MIFDFLSQNPTNDPFEVKNEVSRKLRQFGIPLNQLFQKEFTGRTFRHHVLHFALYLFFKYGHGVLVTLQISYIIIWHGKSERSDWFFLGRDFAIWTVSVEMVISRVFFVFESPLIQNKHGPSAIK